MPGSVYVLSGGTKLFAAICVTYPVGSTLTCTGNGQTWTAKTTSGQWVFAVPKAGTYTLKAVSGSNSKSQNVSITAEGQFVSVELNYVLYLFKEGTGVGAGYELNPVGSNNSVTNQFFSSTSYSGNTNWYFSPKVNISNYSKLHIEADFTGRYDDGRNLYFGVSDTIPTNGLWDINNYISYTYLPFNNDGSRYTASLDLSSITGERYVVIRGSGVSYNVYNFWLE